VTSKDGEKALEEKEEIIWKSGMMWDLKVNHLRGEKKRKVFLI